MQNTVIVKRTVSSIWPWWKAVSLHHYHLKVSLHHHRLKVKFMGGSRGCQKGPDPSFLTRLKSFQIHFSSKNATFMLFKDSSCNIHCPFIPNKALSWHCYQLLLVSQLPKLDSQFWSLDQFWTQWRKMVRPSFWPGAGPGTDPCEYPSP